MANPWFEWRFQLLSRARPKLVPDGVVVGRAGRCDRWGYSPIGVEAVTDEQYQAGRARAFDDYAWALGDFAVSPHAGRALGDLVDRCGEENIPLLIVKLTEAGEFRDLYSPTTRARLDELYGSVLGRPGVALADAQSWVPDHLFANSHHLLPRGAALFTDRLGDEHVLPRLKQRVAGATRHPAQ